MPLLLLEFRTKVIFSLKTKMYHNIIYWSRWSMIMTLRLLNSNSKLRISRWKLTNPHLRRQSLKRRAVLFQTCFGRSSWNPLKKRSRRSRPHDCMSWSFWSKTTRSSWTKERKSIKLWSMLSMHSLTIFRKRSRNLFSPQIQRASMSS